MVGQGSRAIPPIARRVGRDFIAVRAEMHALHQSGVIDRTEGGRMALHRDVSCPYVPLAAKRAA